jgi:enolase-phosphatase E1
MKAVNIPASVRVILLDIEGTTTPIDFVYQTLFPFARRRVADYLARHLSDEGVRADLAELRAEWAADEARGQGPPAWPAPTDSPENSLEHAVAYIHWQMDRDRKSTPLKSLQGKIWEEGFRAGELKSEVFADVPRALERWRGQRRQVFIYSSGSALAQQLLFAHTAAGDLTGLIGGYFDTRVGAKREAESYRRIAESVGRRPTEIVFVSDVTAELDAARATGMRTLLAVRPGNADQPPSELHPRVTTFDDIFPQID